MQYFQKKHKRKDSADIYFHHTNFLQITHCKRPTNSVVPFKPLSPPLNIAAGLIEYHREFRTTLIRGEGGEQAIQW